VRRTLTEPLATTVQSERTCKAAEQSEQGKTVAGKGVISSALSRVDHGWDGNRMRSLSGAGVPPVLRGGGPLRTLPPCSKAKPPHVAGGVWWRALQDLNLRPSVLESKKCGFIRVCDGVRRGKDLRLGADFSPLPSRAPAVSGSAFFGCVAPRVTPRCRVLSMMG
jgi:hypothetical protein